MDGYMDGWVCLLGPSPLFACFSTFASYCIVENLDKERTQELRLGQGDEGDNNDADQMMMMTTTKTMKWGGVG